MAQYVFQCCGRTVNVLDDSVSPVTLPHLCLNDIPCVGLAYASSQPQTVAIADPSTVVVDPIVPTQLDGTDGGTPNNGDGQ
jgi:hypothetical protein